MSRFFIEERNITGNKAEIVGDEEKHIRKVLRLGIGDTLVLFDGAGWEYHAMIKGRNAKGFTVDILKKFLPHRESPLEIILGQGLPRLPKMDFIVQKATELGVSEILSFNSHRSIPKLSEEKLYKKVQRWRKIALEATKQCGRNIIPRIETPVSFAEMLAKDLKDGLKLILWEEATVRLKKVFDMNQDRTKFFVLVGPEGGFTHKETQEAEEAGFNVVSLGNRILRSETAGISILSVIQHRFGDLN